MESMDNGEEAGVSSMEVWGDQGRLLGEGVSVEKKMGSPPCPPMAPTTSQLAGGGRGVAGKVNLVCFF